MNQDHVLIHYGEIALKGGNRNYFEKQLIENIKSQLNNFCPSGFEYVKKTGGSILIKLNGNGTNNQDKIKDALLHTPGIANFSFAFHVKNDFETLKNFCWETIKQTKLVGFKTFRVRAQRSNKNFSMTSEQLNRELGGFIFDKLKGEKSVSLKNPDLEIKVFILDEFALVAMEKISGLGGLPVGSGKKALGLLSGGFDSPVAAFQVLRRGVQLRYAHFHSAPYTSKASIEKVVALSKELAKFGASSKIFLIPFADVQKEIMMKTPEKFRVILYRRMMFRIAEKIANREKCLALVTGDSIGQVASQTLENILVINEAATLPIFRPLIGEDKENIMEKARSIGTFDISIQPHDDCCTRLMPKKPETRAKLWEVLEAEKNLDVPSLINETLKKVEIIK